MSESTLVLISRMRHYIVYWNEFVQYERGVIDLKSTDVLHVPIDLAR